MSNEMEMRQIVLIRECLRKQVEEYELLKSMYSNPGEFQQDNPYLAKDIEDFLCGNRASIDEKLDYRIKLEINEKIKIELSVLLSHYYPAHEQPLLMIRTDSFTRQQEKLVKEAIEHYIETEIDKNEAYMFHVITWLQENFERLIGQQKKAPKIKSSSENKLQRVWLWSHHIYSKIKRQDIIKLTKDYDLCGFMWPGKPGVICFEGNFEDVDNTVKIIKSWQWQKLKIVKVENEDGEEGNFFRFSKFKEILTNEDDTENAKMDSSEFFKYLDAHQSGNMKKELFGFE
jgi:RWD domain/Protein of unknown function (DUF1115)